MDCYRLCPVKEDKVESVIAQIISAISPSALPIVVCVLGLAWIYWKIGRDRKVTKTERDTAHDDLDKRLTLLENEVKQIKDLDLASKLAQIMTDLEWIKENMKHHK